jgi:3-oxoacyl-[acyl-carrier protein] reductase
MTVVVLAAGQTLSRALADSFADAVVIGGHDADGYGRLLS